MKKIAAMIVSTALCLSLVACGGKTNNGAAAPAAAPEAKGETKTEAAAWPSGDVTIYVPANAGGGTDTITRIYVEKFKEVTGANFIVVNDTTGANSVAYETVRTADPDGLTLMSYHGGICAQYASGQYDHSLDEFTVCGSMSTVDRVGYGIWVSGKSQFTTFEELIDYAKEHPGELVAGIETNNTDHMLEAMLEKQLGFDMSVVSAGSNAEKIPLLMGGNLDVCFFAPAGVSDYHTSGDLRCLALFGDEASPLLEGVPTFADLDIEPLFLPMFAFLAGPADMPEEVVNAVNEAIKAAVEDEDLRAAVLNMGYGLDGYVSVEDSQKNAHEMQAKYVEGAELIKE